MKYEGVTLALDPGKNTCGLTLLEADQVLVCSLSVLPKGNWKLGEVCGHHLFNIRKALGSNPLPDRVVVEEQRVSVGRDSKVASRIIAVSNDLLCLQAVGAFVAGALAARVQYVDPPKWPKDVTEARVARALSPEEQRIVVESLKPFPKGLHHNALDSCLHGLIATGRYG